MASSAPNKSLAARASTVLTTAEVAATAFDLNNAFNSQVCVDVAFTLGMLTNVTLRFYASVDGVNWDAVAAPVAAPAAMAAVLTASANLAVPLPALPGYKFVRVSAQGSGTVTNSLLALSYRYLRRGSQ